MSWHTGYIVTIRPVGSSRPGECVLSKLAIPAPNAEEAKRNPRVAGAVQRGFAGRKLRITARKYPGLIADWRPR